MIEAPKLGQHILKRRWDYVHANLHEGEYFDEYFEVHGYNKPLKGCISPPRVEEVDLFQSTTMFSVALYVK